MTLTLLHLYNMQSNIKRFVLCTVWDEKSHTGVSLRDCGRSRSLLLDLVCFDWCNGGVCCFSTRQENNFSLSPLGASSSACTSTAPRQAAAGEDRHAPRDSCRKIITIIRRMSLCRGFSCGAQRCLLQAVMGAERRLSPVQPALHVDAVSIWHSVTASGIEK